MRRIDLIEYKKITLEILIKIDKICRENQIKYFLFAGTLLGAIRHKGFIPWDDDIDICMMREDYDKLAKIIQTNDYGLNFIRTEEYPETIYPYGKVCDLNTRMVEKNFKPVDGYGAFVDVFPFDYMPDSDTEMEKISKKYFRKYQILTHGSRTGYEITDSKITNMKRCLAFWMSRFIDPRKMVCKMNEDFKQLNNVQTKHVGLGWYRKTWLLEDYLEPSEIVFEGYKFYAPKNPDRVLRTHFGDYMKLPPEEQRISNHQLECYVVD